MNCGTLVLEELGRSLGPLTCVLTEQTEVLIKRDAAFRSPVCVTSVLCCPVCDSETHAGKVYSGGSVGSAIWSVKHVQRIDMRTARPKCYVMRDAQWIERFPIFDLTVEGSTQCKCTYAISVNGPRLHFWARAICMNRPPCTGCNLIWGGEGGRGEVFWWGTLVFLELARTSVESFGDVSLLFRFYLFLIISRSRGRRSTGCPLLKTL